MLDDNRLTLDYRYREIEYGNDLLDRSYPF